MNDVPPQPNRGIGWVRFIVWLMPTCIAGVAMNALPRLRVTPRSLIVLLAAAIILVCLAHYDSLLSFHQRQVTRNSRPAEFNANVVVFFLTQLFIVILLGAIVWGYSAIAD